MGSQKHPSTWIRVQLLNIYEFSYKNFFGSAEPNELVSFSVKEFSNIYKSNLKITNNLVLTIFLFLILPKMVTFPAWAACTKTKALNIISDSLWLIYYFHFFQPENRMSLLQISFSLSSGFKISIDASSDFLLSPS